MVIEVQIFDAQAEAFHEAKTGAVEELCHEFVVACEVGDDGASFVFGEDGRDAFVLLRAKG